MKRNTTFFLTIVMLLSLTACGGSTPAATTAAATVPATAAVTEPTTEPTLSPEEELYNSLPDRMRQAVDCGLVELSRMEDLERTVAVREASEMLQKAYIYRTGMGSKNLNDLMNSAEYAELDADHFWMWNLPCHPDLHL